MRLGAGVAALFLAAALLSACHSPNDHAVATSVVAPPPGCDAGRVVVIGASLDLSGPGAALGREYLAGLELGVARVNASGGVAPHNSCFELMYKDDRGSAAIDDQALEDLVHVEKAQVVVSSFLGAGTAHDLGSLGVPAISLSDAALTYRPAAFPNTFPVTASMASEAFVMAGALAEERVSRVALVVTDDTPSEQGATDLAALARPHHFSIVARATVAPSGAGAAAALARVRAARPEVVVIVDDASAATAVLAARLRARWSVPVLAGPSATEGRAGAGAAGVSVVVPSGAVAGRGPTPAVSFRRRLLAALHRGSLTGSIIPYAETYDAMTMLANAANGAAGMLASGVTTFLQNANYQGVLASYTYTAAVHTGVSASDQVVAALDTLADGVLHRAPKAVSAP